MPKRFAAFDPARLSDPLEEFIQEGKGPAVRIQAQGGGTPIEVADGAGSFSTFLGEGALPEALGLVAWTVDPAKANFYATQANVKLVAVFLPSGKTITNIAVPVTVAGATLTSVELGVYDQTMTAPVAKSANGAATFNGATGWVSLPMQTPYTTPYSGLYYFSSAYAGTTLPTVGNVQQTGAVLVGQMPNGKWRYMHAQAQGTLPSPPSSTGGAVNVPIILAY